MISDKISIASLDELYQNSAKMQGMVRGAFSIKKIVKGTVLKNCEGSYVKGNGSSSRIGCVTSSFPSEQKGLENITVADILITKGQDKVGSWLWCHTNDFVDDAAKNVRLKTILLLLQFWRTVSASSDKFSCSCRWQKTILDR